eukprot:7877053-Ditylum_brightwellii.AAC.1
MKEAKTSDENMWMAENTKDVLKFVIIDQSYNLRDSCMVTKENHEVIDGEQNKEDEDEGERSRKRMEDEEMQI